MSQNGIATGEVIAGNRPVTQRTSTIAAETLFTMRSGRVAQPTFAAVRVTEPEPPRACANTETRTVETAQITATPRPPPTRIATSSTPRER
jgi:hypothetical protein